MAESRVSNDILTWGSKQFLVVETVGKVFAVGELYTYEISKVTDEAVLRLLQLEVEGLDEDKSFGTTPDEDLTRAVKGL